MQRSLLLLLSFVSVFAVHSESLRELDWELINACADGNVAEVERVLNLGAKASATTPDGESALHVAGISGKAEIVRLLVAAGAALDQRTTSARGLYMTPLSWFVYGQHADGVKALIDAGASVNAIVIDESGTRITPVDIAKRIKADTIVSILVAAGGKPYETLSHNNDQHDSLLPSALLMRKEEGEQLSSL